MALTLYQAEWCPYCHRVRQVLSELELTYTNVNVPVAPEDRKVVREVSGQDIVPVLVDGDEVLIESEDIVDYLRETYPAPDDAGDHEEQGHFRLMMEVAAPPAVTLDALRAALTANDIVVLSESRGPDLGVPDLNEDYVLLQAAVPGAVVEALGTDPTVPAALSFRLAVFPTETGTAIVSTRPSAEVWVYAKPELSRLGLAVNQLLYKALDEIEIPSQE